MRLGGKDGGSGRGFRFSLRPAFRPAPFGIGVNLGAVFFFAAHDFFVGHRQNGVHHFGERRVFYGMSHQSQIISESLLAQLLGSSPFLICAVAVRMRK